MQQTKRVGRPRAFDSDEALMAAMNLFWSKGYDGTSVKDLTHVMGINAPSLYATYGDKHALYLRAIHRYISNDACAPLVAFESEVKIDAAVLAFMEASIDYATDNGSGARGCFLASCVSTNAGEVDGVEPLLQRAIKDTDKRLATRFEEEKAKGVLPADFPSLERARLLFDLRQGHVFRARAGIARRAMRRDLHHRVKMVLAH